MPYPESFKDLISHFKRLPGVGQKTAERYAFSLLKQDQEVIDSFSKSLIKSYSSLKRCSQCGNITDQFLCNICSDNSRRQDLICVVESPQDVFAMERLNEYHGLYHVLHGLISTSKGVLPENLNLQQLTQRLSLIKEIIIATNFTLEGETTALYLTKLLGPYDLTISRLAHGLPMGGHLDYTDDLTLSKALEGRNKLR